jgi:sigma-B regulation protein RsbU (phosphoserine phosphatase)
MAEEKRSNPNIDSSISYNDAFFAQQILETMLLKEVPKVPGYQFAFHYVPKRIVGGDYCDFVSIDENQTAIIVADVSGHGVSGAIVAVGIRTLIHREIRRVQTPRLLLALVNKFLYEDTPKGLYCTMTYMVLQQKERRLTYVSAGHQPLIVKRYGNPKLEFHDVKSVPLGVDTSGKFQSTLTENVIQLGVGDVVMGYTDGVTEARNPAGEDFTDTFHQLIRQHSEVPLKELHSTIFETLQRHTQSVKQEDDVTMVSLRVNRE